MDCTYCGENFTLKWIKRHRSKCFAKIENIFEFSYCRFCNLECCDNFIFKHEEECILKKEFSPYNYEDRLNYYKGLLNYDPQDKSSKSDCRHCNRSVLSINIFKHEEGCLRQLDKFIGPMPEKRRCNYCLKYFYVTHNEHPTYYNGRPTIKVFQLLKDHEEKCRNKSVELTKEVIGDVTVPRRVLRSKIVATKNIVEFFTGNS